MSVDLSPPELGFKRPFTHEVSQVLRLRNPNNAPVAFKVKTTAPKQYCVRPNSGRIEPGQDVEVQVLLQAMKEDPPPDARCRDKFLVQSVGISPEQDVNNVTQIWQNIEQTAKTSIQEKKIRVTFLPADGTASVATNGVHHDDEPPAYSSPSPAAVTPQRSAAQIDRSPLADSTADITHSAMAAVSNTTGISQDDMRRQLDEAKATIARLQQQAAESTGLRQRKTGGETTTANKTQPASMQSAPPAGGVPVQIVAALCLICFLIAYLFF
ncbi:Vesicle-associated membrane -associated [Lecanosticta acicola]|uniref:Vesicle-associated membrane -associated n=1 Tax=Lecanosticta acicola TaxID=111012 RepID=A0AAI8YTW5_9PEZI|nr:Vesicle-associated membrane -associated [Lecanosticta acicola]